MLDTTKDRNKILLKFINNTLHNSIDPDILSILRDQTTESTSPVLYSIMNVWRISQMVILREEVMYAYENKLMSIFKDTYSDDLVLLAEFFRIIILNELDDLCIYMDLSEKLAQITLFIFACFYDKEEIKPLHNIINTYVEANYELIKEINKNVVSVLGGDF